MRREKLKWKAHKSQSTDAWRRDGLERSSEEASVMEVERRSLGYSAMNVSQPAMGGADGQSKAI